MSNNPYSSECEWGVGRSGATGLYLGGQLAGAERLGCIWVGSWQERSDWVVFGWIVGRSGATGLYLARRRRARFVRAVKCGPPQAGSNFECC